MSRGNGTIKDGCGTDQLACVESNGGLAVNVQDQHTKALDLKFLKAYSPPTTLTVQANPEDTSVTVADTTNFVAGVFVGLVSSLTGHFYFAQQVGAPVGNVISLDTPIDKTFVIGSNIFPATDNMAVDGSTTTQIFQIGPVGAVTEIGVDITRLLGYIQDGTVMGDATFGGISALTHGVVLRHNNSVIDNIWNVKTNGDFGLICFDIDYTLKPPAGSYGFRFRNTYAGPSKHGVTIRLAAGDTLEVLIQDDLTGLEKFTMMAQGHLVDNF